MPYTPRQTATLRVVFDDATGQRYDVDALALRLRPPAGVDLTFTLAAGQVLRESLGSYVVRTLLPVVGVWEYQWDGTRGDLVAQAAGAIRVVPSAFPR